MTCLYLVRNGRTEEGAGFEVDPPLDDVGRIQAESVAGLLESLPNLKIVSSPQRRALETAAPLLRKRNVSPIVDESLTVMPLPDKETCDRKAWLVRFMKSRWCDAPEMQVRWRKECLARLSSVRVDTVLFSHFVVINMVLGGAIGDDRVTVFEPDNGSITILETTGGKLKLLERGRQAATWLL
jgi:broad specificity phosphatase PhoE